MTKPGKLIALAALFLISSGAARAAEVCGRISNGPITVNGQFVPAAFQIAPEDGSPVIALSGGNLQDQLVDLLGKDACVKGEFDGSGFFVVDEGSLRPRADNWRCPGRIYCEG